MASSTFKVGDKVRYIGSSPTWKGGEAVVVREFSCDVIVVNFMVAPPELRASHTLAKLRYLGFRCNEWEKCDGLFDI